MAKFVHLHTHSHYSFLEALPKVPDLVKKAADEEMPALALTDAGNLHGAIAFYKAAAKKGVKAIIGVDAYLAPRSRFDKDPVQDAKRSRIVLLAENNAGYKNLLKIVSASHIEGFLDKPRVDLDLLREHKEGIIALIPSIGGNVAHMLAAGDRAGASAAIAAYQSVFAPENLFLEITRHPLINGHESRMLQLIDLSKESGVPLVAQHDVYYLSPSDRPACEIMRRIKYGSSAPHEEEDFSFVNEVQMRKWFSHIPDAISRSGEIAERCNVTFDLGSWVFPAFPVPEGKTHEQILREETYEGLLTRSMASTPEVVERIEYELSVIIGKGFAPYFLAVSDLLKHAKSKGILTTTRGSAAGSLVSYLVGITNVDPLLYKLPFERFLNPERPKAPDVDMDFADNRRDEMIAYAKEKYGAANVAQIGTFGTMMARAAARDVARALGHSYGTGDRIAKLIPLGAQGFPMTIARALKMEPDLKALYDEDDDVREILDLAMRIEGCARQTGVHAAGVVIAPTPLTEWTALQVDPKTGKLITQYDMHDIEEAGLLKFDFLGIKNLSILADAVARVEEIHGVTIDIENIPIDDTKTYEMLARGETEGTFQLNGSGMTRYLKELQPTTIHDINAMVALYRPGPMEVIPDYIQRKNNPSLIKYLDPRMEAFLDASYGLLVYQDDLLYCAVYLAGYSWGDVDKFRKAIGKKIPAEMAAQKEQFVKGIIANGRNEAFANKLWVLFEPFQAYGFNKCLPGDVRILDAVTGIPTTIEEMRHRTLTPHVVSMNSQQRLVLASASKIFENGVKDVYKLTTRSGRTIRATDNHPFRTFTDWVELGSLNVGTRIAVPRYIPEPASTLSIDYYKAATLGYLVSEGNLCHPHGIYFYSTQEDEIEDFTYHALQFTNAKITIDRSKSAASVYVGQNDPTLGNTLAGWIETCGLRNKKARAKFIPNVIFSAPNEMVAVFLGKLWQGDGSVSVANWQMMYATSSRRLAEDVQHLLLRFSIIGTIHTKEFKYRGGIKTGWSVVVSGNENILRFMKTIGKHLIGNKKDTLQLLFARSSARTNMLGRGTPDTVPMNVLEEIRSEMHLSEMSPTTVATAASVSVRLLGADRKKRGITRDSLLKIGHAIDSKKITEHATSDIFWDEVTSIALDGREMTYDLSVPGEENFVANDFIVHNSHAACYGKVAYQTAYMKANYPVEYMAAVLTADSGDTESIAIFVAECTRMGIPVLPPDVNESGTDFTPLAPSEEYPKGAIRFGLSSIKNFGEGIAHAILDERRANGPFDSLQSFLSRVAAKALNRKSLESLIKSGALDRFTNEEGGRGYLIAHIETLLAFHRDATAEAPQDSLFGASAPPATLLLPPPSETTSVLDMLSWEKELLGIYVSGHPLDSHAAYRDRAGTSIKQLKESPEPGRAIILPVLVTEVKTHLTKGGDKMAFVKFEDLTDSIEAVIFNKLYKEQSEAVLVGQCILVKGTVSIRNGETTLAIENVKKI